MTIMPAILRNGLAAVWVLFALIDSEIILLLYRGDWIGDESLSSAFKQLNRIFAPYLGAILAYYLATRPNTRGRARSPHLMPFIVALSACVFWNSVNLFFLTMLWVGHSTVKMTLDQIDQYSTLLAWVVSPAMGYFFGAHLRQSG
jgi:hypothetical protein